MVPWVLAATARPAAAKPHPSNKPHPTQCARIIRNGLQAVSGFTDGRSYCCPEADECLAHGQSDNLGLNPGLTVPVCLKGSPATVELCRRENDNLLPTIQVDQTPPSPQTHCLAGSVWKHSCPTSPPTLALCSLSCFKGTSTALL